MRAVVQRVHRASVRVDGETVGAIDHGLCVFLGVGPDDSEDTARHLADRIIGLRILADGEGRMNCDVRSTAEAVLVVSQFTLYADTSRGHRPSFIGAGAPELAERLCSTVVDAVRAAGIQVATGRFAARMDVDLVNDGPVTVVLSSGEGPWPADAG